MNEIEEVKSRLDIVEIIGQYISLQKAGRTFKSPCPFHQEKTPSFIVSPDRQSWHCFGACGTGGDVISFVMKREGIDFPEALRMLAERAGVKLPERRTSEEQDKSRQRLYSANEAAAEYFQQLLRADPGRQAQAYVEHRGLDDATSRAFRLGYSLNAWEACRDHLRAKGFTDRDLLGAGLVVPGDNGLYDRFRGRLMFAVWDPKGRIIGFGARALDDSTPKYLNTAQTGLFDKGGTLYALHAAQDAIRSEGRAVIVEGYMDVIAAHQHGFRNVVAQMGTALTERQVQLLKRVTGEIVLALDADTAGLEAAVRGHDVIRASGEPAESVDWRGLVRHQEIAAVDLRVAVLPAGRDPDDIIRADADLWRSTIASAEPVLDFRLDRAALARNLADPRARSGLVKEFLPLLNAVGDPVVRAHYLQRLSRLAITDEEEILRMVKGNESRRPVSSRPQPVRRDSIANPREDFLLALLLQFPALRGLGAPVSEDLLWDAQGKQLLQTLRNHPDAESVIEYVPAELHSYVERLILWKLPISAEEQAVEALQDCIDKLGQRRLQAEKQAIAAQIAALQECLGLGVTEQSDQAPPPAGVEELQHLLQRDMEIGRQLHSRGRKDGISTVHSVVDG